MVLTRNYPIVVGTGLAVMLFSLVGAAAITGVLPASNEDSGSPAHATAPAFAVGARVRVNGHALVRG